MLQNDFVSILNLISIGAIVYVFYQLPKSDDKKTLALWFGGAFILFVMSSLMGPALNRFGIVSLALIFGLGAGCFAYYFSGHKFQFRLYALFQTLLGLGLFFVALSAFYHPEAYAIGPYGQLFETSLFMIALTGFLGALTSSAMIVSFSRREGLLSSDYLHFENQNFIHAILFFLLLFPLIWVVFAYSAFAYWLLLLLSLALGASVAMKIQENDLELFIKIMNILLGIGITFSGFALNITILIIIGTLIATIGYCITTEQCRAKNRSLTAIMIGDNSEVIFDYEDDSDIEDADFELEIDDEPEETNKKPTKKK